MKVTALQQVLGGPTASQPGPASSATPTSNGDIDMGDGEGEQIEEVSQSTLPIPADVHLSVVRFIIQQRRGSQDKRIHIAVEVVLSPRLEQQGLIEQPTC